MKEFNIKLSEEEFIHVKELVYKLFLGYAGRTEHWGHFLTYVARNDLVRAVLYADDTNQRALPIYARIIYNEVPNTLVKF